MKKTILASAIAAATFSGAAMAQEINLPVVYGNIQYALAYENIDDGGYSVDHFDNGSTLGVAHSHEIAPGITGFFKMELEGINADDKSGSNGIDGLDEAYIGVKGDSFGQVWVGSDDSTYESAIDKIANFFEVGSYNLGGGYTTGEGDLIQYLSPSFGGFKLGAAVQVNGTEGAGKSYPYQLAAIYSVDALELAFAMDSNDGKTGYSSAAALTPNNNENTYGLRATYNLEDLSLTAQFQTRKDVEDKFGLMGVYTLGKNQFALAYEHASADGDLNPVKPGDQDVKETVTVQALHNLSDHMYVYVEGYLAGGDQVYPVAEGSAVRTDEKTIAAVGAVYYF
ncbi:porin [Cycloclasticus pugetii]|uniref:porin n=1 Tax=Cycloclasticus pugetii TaxID=34068 RepID=UPI003A93CD8B